MGEQIDETPLSDPKAGASRAEKIYILHLETATRVCSVALSLNGEIRQLREIREDGYAHGEKLTLLIEEALQLENITASAVSAVSVSSGPGSYTGLRIGVSTAKGLCYALTIPLIAVDSLRCIRQLAAAKYPGTNIIPMIDARRMEVFSAAYDGAGNTLKSISADIIEPDTYAALEPFVACGDGAAKLAETWQHRPGVIIDSDVLSSASGQVAAAYEKFAGKAFEDVAYFEPFYLKDFVMNTKKS